MQAQVFRNPGLRSIGDIVEAIQEAGRFHQLRVISGHLPIHVQGVSQGFLEPVRSYMFGLNKDSSGFYVADGEVNFRRIGEYAGNAAPYKIEIGGNVLTPEIVAKVQEALGLVQVSH